MKRLFADTFFVAATLAFVAGTTPALAHSAFLKCTVTSSKGYFHSANPPREGDWLALDLTDQHVGDPRKGIVFTRPNGTESLVPFYGIGKVQPGPGEAARYEIQALRPDGHVTVLLTVSENESQATLMQKWDSMNSSQTSTLVMGCQDDWN